METVRRIRLALLGFGLVVLAGSVGYVFLGFTPLEAVYQAVTTVSTVGFREVHEFGPAGQVFTILLILFGAGTALYAFGVLLEALVEGGLRHHLKERRMAREIDRMTDHVIICGWGRVGHACAAYLRTTGRPLVVVDHDADRVRDPGHPRVIGDVTDDAVLSEAGIERAHALVAALDSDADNVYVTLSARALRPDLVIIARARNEASKSKLLRAGANRAVNPQMIGGRRMAVFALQRHVAEFVDGVMHDESLDYRMEQIEIVPGSPLAGQPLSGTTLAGNSDGVLLAIRTSADGEFLANPAPDTVLGPGTILIVVGTSIQLKTLQSHATPH